MPSERQVEALARKGQRAKTLRELTAELAELAATGRERAGPEATRLVAETVTPRADLAELVDSGLGALRMVGATAAELSALPGARAELFSAALTAADARLAGAKLRDERGDAWLAKSAVATTQGVLPGVTELEVAAGNRLGPGELALLEQLHAELRRRGGGVTLRFPGVSGEQSRRAVESEQSRLEARWAEQNDAPSVVRDDDKPVSGMQLTFTRSPNLESEARATVRAVQERLSAGAHLDRIAIVPLELSEAFLEELRSALSVAGIPFSEPRGRPPIAGPNVHASLELLRLAAGPIRRDSLLDVLAAPGLDTRRWFGGERRALHGLRELLSRTPVGFDRSGELLLEHVARVAQGQKSGSPEAALAGLRATIGDLQRLAGDRPRAELARAFTEWIDDLGLWQVSAPLLRTALDERDQGRPSLLRALSDDARGSASVREALARLARAAERLGLGDERVGLRTFAAELARALEGVSQARGAARSGAVAIARPREVAGLELDLAVICRASAACFAKVASASATLWLGSELCEHLPAARRPPTARDEEAQVLTALNSLLGSAGAVELVWSTSDAASETRESAFVESLLRATGKAIQDEPGSPLAPGARRIAALPTETRSVELRSDVERQRQAFFFGHGEPSELTGRVSDLDAWLAPHLPPLPVTRLERYVDCGFLGFAAIVLRAVRDEAITDGLGARERGVLIHAAVAEALTAISGMHRPEAELLEIALGAADGTLAQHRGSALRGAALRAARSDVRSLVRWSLEHRELGFRFAEKAFGDGEAWGPLELGPYRLTGRIDRIDVSSDGQSARVIDYKSGTPPSRSEDSALQGWLYARKVAQELGAAEVQSMYLGLARRVPIPREIYKGTSDGAELLERERAALGKLERLKHGHIAAEPTRPSRCARCDARDICRRPLSAPAGDDTEGEA